MIDIHINIGSNSGDRAALIERAVAAVSSIFPDAVEIRRSDIIETPPWGFDSPNPFLNIGMLVRLDSNLALNIGMPVCPDSNPVVNTGMHMRPDSNPALNIGMPVCPDGNPGTAVGTRCSAYARRNSDKNGIKPDSDTVSVNIADSDIIGCDIETDCSSDSPVGDVETDCVSDADSMDYGFETDCVPDADCISSGIRATARPYNASRIESELVDGAVVISQKMKEKFAVDVLHSLQRVQASIDPSPHRDATGAYIDRAIDIDLIAINDWAVETPELSLPHPRMLLRDFVMVPLKQLDPQWKHPST